MGVLLMLMTIGGLIAAAALLVFSFVYGKAWLRTFVLGGIVVWVVFYTIHAFRFLAVKRRENPGTERGKEVLRFLSRLPYAHSR
jgi:hypothetical protein